MSQSKLIEYDRMTVGIEECGTYVALSACYAFVKYGKSLKIEQSYLNRQGLKRFRYLLNN